MAKNVKRPVIATSALITRARDAAVLLVERKYAPGGGKWSFPGGTLEWGETCEECARREVEEETGLAIEIERLHGVYDVIGHERNYGPYHFVIVCYKARPIAGEVRLGDEVANAAWVSKRWLKAFNLTSSTVEALRDAGLL